jgi:cell division protein FtsN
VVPDAFIKNVGTQYRVQAGAYSARANAENRAAELKNAGINAIIKTE